MKEPTRRDLLAASSAAAVGGVLAVGLAGATAADTTSTASMSSADTSSADTASGVQAGAGDMIATVPFHGAHQAGIDTPMHRFGSFIGLDLAAGSDRAAVRRLLLLLTDDAARLTQGRAALGDTEPELASRPARLTVTLGFGPALFDLTGTAAKRPASVRTLPAFTGDKLQERWGQSHLVAQVCADDRTVLAHTERMLIKDMRTFGSVRWVQRGFSSPGATPRGTARNLLGQVDGTINPQPGTAEFQDAVWSAEPQWLTGGSVLVLRRVAMHLDLWDAFDRDGKERVIGRRLDDGAPLTGGQEQDVVNLNAVDAMGFPVIEPYAHTRLAKSRSAAETLLRRPFSYDEGVDAAGRPDAGLLFACYQADADTAFVPVQKRLAGHDLLNTWVTHIGSAVYAVPPGAAEGEYLGQALLEG